MYTNLHANTLMIVLSDTTIVYVIRGVFYHAAVQRKILMGHFLFEQTVVTLSIHVIQSITFVLLW